MLNLLSHENETPVQATWWDIREGWKWAHMSDAQFLELAATLGREDEARALITEDLENPQ